MSACLLSLGLRTDANNYSDEMSNFLINYPQDFQPHISLQKNSRQVSILGRYFQLPAYTVMGYADNDGNLINKENGITYIQSDHIVAGVQYNPTRYSKISVEAFYKKYDNYPFLTNDSISLQIWEETLVSLEMNQPYLFKRS